MAKKKFQLGFSSETKVPQLGSGTFNDYVDFVLVFLNIKGARFNFDKVVGGPKMSFLSTFRVENVHVEVGGGQKRAKLCPRSD